MYRVDGPDPHKGRDNFWGSPGVERYLKSIMKSYLAGGCSDAAFRCQYCSNLLASNAMFDCIQCTIPFDPITVISRPFGHCGTCSRVFCIHVAVCRWIRITSEIERERCVGRGGRRVKLNSRRWELGRLPWATITVLRAINSNGSRLETRQSVIHSLCLEPRQCFYRAMLCIRGTSHGPVSVCVCPSVCHKSELY